MITHDPRRLRTLQRRVDDAKRVRRLFRAIITVILIIVWSGPGLIVLGNLLDTSWVANFGGGILVFAVVGLIFSPAYFVDRERKDTPFQDVRDAERALEDYYDEVGNSL